MDDISVSDLAIFSLTAIGGIIAFVYARREYKKSVEIKRAEFLDKLIADFLDPGTEIARSLLDDYVYVKKEDRDKLQHQQKELATPLKTYLRNHKNADAEPITPDEFDVRKSFDNLLDFITKLSYYLRQDLITVAELEYFRYYLVKIDEKKEDLQEYIEAYFYPQDIELVIQGVK